MRLRDLFTAKSVKAYIENKAKTQKPLLGKTLFPSVKQTGLELKFIKGSNGLPVLLQPSALDTKSRGRGKSQVERLIYEMPYFKEHIKVNERDEQEMLRVQNSNEPYAQEVLNRVYPQASGLVDSADVTAELMTWQLLAPVDGKPKISIINNGASYVYDFDADGSYAKTHFTKLMGTSKWTDTTNSTPLDDIHAVIDKADDNGVTIEAMVITSEVLGNLTKNKSIASVILSQNSTPNIQITRKKVIEVIENDCDIKVIVYNNKYVGYDEKEHKFYPAEMATFLPAGELGKMRYGTSPIERQAMEDKNADVAQVNIGVNILVTSEHDPEQTKTVVDQICMPSYEGMDGVYLLNHSSEE